MNIVEVEVWQMSLFLVHLVIYGLKVEVDKLQATDGQNGGGSVAENDFLNKIR